MDRFYGEKVKTRHTVVFDPIEMIDCFYYNTNIIFKVFKNYEVLIFLRCSCCESWSTQACSPRCSGTMKSIVFVAQIRCSTLCLMFVHIGLTTAHKIIVIRGTVRHKYLRNLERLACLGYMYQIGIHNKKPSQTISCIMFVIAIGR